MITMQSWLFLSSQSSGSESFEEHELLTMVHLGVNAFSTLNSKVVSTTAFVIQVGRGSERAVGNYLRLVEGADETRQVDHAARTPLQVRIHGICIGFVVEILQSCQAP